jgi:hypothetical protein
MEPSAFADSFVMPIASRMRLTLHMMQHAHTPPQAKKKYPNPFRHKIMGRFLPSKEADKQARVKVGLRRPNH